MPIGNGQCWYITGNTVATGTTVAGIWNTWIQHRGYSMIGPTTRRGLPRRRSRPNRRDSVVAPTDASPTATPRIGRPPLPTVGGRAPPLRCWMPSDTAGRAVHSDGGVKLIQQFQILYTPRARCGVSLRVQLYRAAYGEYNYMC